MPQFRGRGRGGQRPQRDRIRGRRQTARERRESETREAERLDARRAARIARSKKREAYELLREPSAQEVEEARRNSSDDEEEAQFANEISSDTVEAEETPYGRDGERVWWARDEEAEQQKVDVNAEDAESAGGRKRKRGGEDHFNGSESSLKKLKRSDLESDSTAGCRGSSAASLFPPRSTASTGTVDSMRIEVPSLNAVEQQEKEFLHSDAFPVSEIQPARDFLEIMAAISDVFGDSAAGWSRFGPESPLKPILVSSAEAALDHNRYMLSNSLEAHKSDPNSFLYEKRRKFSQIVEPRLRTRHLEIDLLQRKISHGEMLSLNLSSKARRVAMDIGGSLDDIANAYSTGPAGWVLWRLVRVSAKVVVPGEGEELHVAWWAILNRNLAGFF